MNVNNKSVSYAYPGEYARIFVFQNKDKSSLVIVISQNISKKINAEREQTLIYFLKKDLGKAWRVGK